MTEIVTKDCTPWTNTTDKEPSVIIFDGFLCDKDAIIDYIDVSKIPPGETWGIPYFQKDNNNFNYITKSTRDNANGIIVPPHVDFIGYDNYNYNKVDDVVNPNAGKIILPGPGIYNLIGTSFNDDITSFEIKKKFNWEDLSTACCLGTIDAKWCGTNDPTKEVNTCDAKMRTYCSIPENKASILCGCINSNIPNLPSCFDKNCVNGGAYKTYDMKLISKGCPTYMSCNEFLKLPLIDRSSVINNNYLTLNCIDPANNNDDIINDYYNDNNANNTNNTMMWVLIIIISIIISIYIYNYHKEILPLYIIANPFV